MYRGSVGSSSASAASPACGPSASPTATARLSRTTGLSVSRDELVVPLDDLHPVGLVGGLRVGVQRRDRRLRLVLAEPVAGQRGLQHRHALGDQVAPPQPAVLLGQRHEAAVGAGPGGASRVVEQEQREQPGDLRVVG